jgi:polysaccharide biosynthesis protein PslH
MSIDRRAFLPATGHAAQRAHSRSRNHPSKPVVLFATPILQHPPLGGPALRIENSIKALSQIADLFVYSAPSLQSIGGRSSLAFYRQYCREFYFADSCRLPIDKSLVFMKRALNFATRRTVRRTFFTTPSAGYRCLLKIADRLQPDAIWLGYGNISYPLLKYIKQHSDYKVVVDTDSVWSRFILRGLSYAVSAEHRRVIEETGREKEKEEAWGTQLADVTTAVSAVDAEYYTRLAEDPARIHIFSNVVDVSSYQEPPAPAADVKAPNIYFAGTFGPRSPMDDAARWMISEILPSVRTTVPNIHFYIVGIGSRNTLRDIEDSGITVTGQVPSVLPYLCHANVAVVPLRFESGTRFKILEAGACGIPVVSTTLGAEGLEVIHGKHIVIADDPGSFAEAIVRLLRDRDLAHRLSENLARLIREKYSIAALVEEGRRILDYLVGPPAVTADTLRDPDQRPTWRSQPAS